MLKCIHRRGEGSLLCGTVCCDVHEAALSGCYVNISSLTVFSLVLHRRSWAYKLNEIAIKTKLSAQWYTGMFKAFAKQSTTFQPMKAVQVGQMLPEFKRQPQGPCQEAVLALEPALRIFRAWQDNASSATTSPSACHRLCMPCCLPAPYSHCYNPSQCSHAATTALRSMR